MKKTIELTKIQLAKIQDQINKIKNSNMNSMILLDLMDLQIRESKLLRTLKEETDSKKGVA